jgi:ribose transport system substrate-binding protein
MLSIARCREARAVAEAVRARFDIGERCAAHSLYRAIAMMADSRHNADAADRTTGRCDTPPFNSLRQRQMCWGLGCWATRNAASQLHQWEEKMRRVSGIAALSLLVALGAAAPVGAASAAEQFVIGVSNTHIGNSWREEFVCSIKAEALASGLVSKIVLANREAGPSEQIADLRTLISAGVNAIIINPSDEKALNGVIKQAADKGIVVVAADQPVSAPEAYIVTGDQVTYAKVGAKWLFDQLKGKGDVYQMRGIDGAPGDTVRQTGFDAVLRDYPVIKVVATTFMDWSNEKAAQQMSAMLASGKHFDGVWTSGIDYTVIEAIKAAKKPFVPFVGADNNGFMKQLIDYKKDGLIGVAVSNSPAIGAAGLVVALDVLQKKPRDKVTTVPTAWYDNTTEEGMAMLKKLYDPNVAPTDPVYGPEKDYGHFTAAQEKDCKGPGE